jgi:RimJ/RimL family protein N-acetyltransferase
MDLQRFAQTQLPALEQDEVRFGILISVLTAVARNPSFEVSCWSVGSPGHCAAHTPGRGILLGRLDEAECRRLAQDTSDVAGSGVVGADDTAHWYAKHAQALGARLGEPLPQRIHVLREAPRWPQAAGTARTATAEDGALLYKWLSAFNAEATPHASPPTREQAEQAAGSGRFLLWTVNGEPVAMAGINRSLRQTASIGAVYTPPKHRGRGFAGSVTAATADRIFADGKAAVSLYTDLRNPISNRCYGKLGFVPYCDSWHYPPDGAGSS